MESRQEDIEYVNQMVQAMCLRVVDSMLTRYKSPDGQVRSDTDSVKSEVDWHTVLIGYTKCMEGVLFCPLSMKLIQIVSFLCTTVKLTGNDVREVEHHCSMFVECLHCISTYDEFRDPENQLLLSELKKVFKAFMNNSVGGLSLLSKVLDTVCCVIYPKFFEKMVSNSIMTFAEDEHFSKETHNVNGLYSEKLSPLPSLTHNDCIVATASTVSMDAGASGGRLSPLTLSNEDLTVVNMAGKLLQEVTPKFTRTNEPSPSTRESESGDSTGMPQTCPTSDSLDDKRVDKDPLKSTPNISNALQSKLHVQIQRLAVNDCMKQSLHGQIAVRNGSEKMEEKSGKDISREGERSKHVSTENKVTKPCLRAPPNNAVHEDGEDTNVPPVATTIQVTSEYGDGANGTGAVNQLVPSESDVLLDGTGKERHAAVNTDSDGSSSVDVGYFKKRLRSGIPTTVSTIQWSSDESEDLVAQSNKYKPKPTRKRRMPKEWTPVEVDYLKKGVEIFGVGQWRKIVNHFPFPSYRTNVDLKDKWRSKCGKK